MNQRLSPPLRSVLPIGPEVGKLPLDGDVFPSPIRADSEC
jgi:hypothetical protein